MKANDVTQIVAALVISLITLTTYIFSHFLSIYTRFIFSRARL